MPTVVLDTPKLKIEAETSGECLALRPIGIIDENMDIGAILNLVKNAHPPVKTVSFDLSGTTRINSVGVREWITLMSKLLSMVSCEFKRVNEIFMEQASMIPTVLGDRSNKIHSFEVPYFCESGCKKRTMVTLEPKDIRFDGGTPEAPARNCEKCGKALVLDCVPETYFSILTEIT